jgi:anti-sigma regulatory factor (Ser/Thr protein kinase)
VTAPETSTSLQFAGDVDEPPVTSDRQASMSCRAQDISNGGACTFQLPSDPSIAPKARYLLADRMRQLSMGQALIENGALAVSELATNARQHAGQPNTDKPIPMPELWIWARTLPTPELIVSVFDGRCDRLPEQANRDPMDESGRGLAIVAAAATTWGTHPSRSRHRLPAKTGKAVWFTLPLPQPWPGSDQIINPGFAAQKLLLCLGARGINATQRSDAKGISLIQVDDLNIWVEPKYFSWSNGTGAVIRHPLIDLQETAERIVHQLTARTGP